jgi:hypothetical protein
MNFNHLGIVGTPRLAGATAIYIRQNYEDRIGLIQNQVAFFINGELRAEIMKSPLPSGVLDWMPADE